MRTFTDTAGRSWSLAINVDVVGRVRSELSVDLLDMASIDRLTGDPVLLCNVLFSILEPSAKQLNVSDVDFGRAMSGDVLDAATTAFLEELTDFFPKSKRQIMVLALRKVRAVEKRVLELATAKLESPELDSQIEAELQKAFTPSSGTSPESPASTPAP